MVRLDRQAQRGDALQGPWRRRNAAGVSGPRSANRPRPVTGKRTWRSSTSISGSVSDCTARISTGASDGLILRKVGGVGSVDGNWPLAAVIVVVGWLLTGVYVSRANGEFDRLNEEILKEAHK